MLKSLTVKNFRAFREAVTIDFAKSGNYTFNPECVENGIVKTAIVYGKNSNGKSSIALAIFDIVANLTDNFANRTIYLNYQNAFSLDQPVEFKFQFQFDKNEVVYEYKKKTHSFIVAEKLSINNKTVVEYDKSRGNDLFIDLAGAGNVKLNLDELKFSILKWLKNNCILHHNAINEAFNDMFNFVNKMLLFWSLEERSFVGYSQISENNIIDEIVKEGHFADLKAFFKEAGFHDELEHKNESGQEKLYFKYNGVCLDFNMLRSTGMSSLLLVFYWLRNLNTEKQPSFICIDEFDAFYHFELAYYLVKILKKCKPQIMLTTHNTTLFSNDILRPDCYYICTRDSIINANNATEKELREGHNLEKLYRGGTFGL